MVAIEPAMPEGDRACSQSNGAAGHPVGYDHSGEREPGMVAIEPAMLQRGEIVPVPEHRLQKLARDGGFVRGDGCLPLHICCRSK